MKRVLFYSILLLALLGVSCGKERIYYFGPSEYPVYVSFVNDKYIVDISSANTSQFSVYIPIYCQMKSGEEGFGNLMRLPVEIVEEETTAVFGTQFLLFEEKPNKYSLGLLRDQNDLRCGHFIVYPAKIDKEETIALAIKAGQFDPSELPKVKSNRPKIDTIRITLNPRVQ